MDDISYASILKDNKAITYIIAVYCGRAEMLYTTFKIGIQLFNLLIALMKDIMLILFLYTVYAVRHLIIFSLFNQILLFSCRSSVTKTYFNLASHTRAN